MRRLLLLLLLPGLLQGAESPWTRVSAASSATVAEGDLHLDHRAGPASSHLLRPAPMALKVGQLYRLSATIRTQGVRVDSEARYPTALGACVSMASFPFTNASPTVAGDDERHVSVTFFATTAQDQIRLDLGRNGKASGQAWFRDVKLEEVADITQHIPLETVRWSGSGFRYDEGGWIFVHVEGEPYARGRQFGELVSVELAKLLDKLAVLEDRANPEKGWSQLRLMADTLMLRKYDLEFLEEMKGIADGAAKAGATFRGRAVDLLDVVTMNSAIDLGCLQEATRVQATPLSGRVFQSAEDEAAKGGKGDHCSSFVATRSATPGGRFVMGQMFMWNGYSGVHWDVILDLVPTKGHRVVMQTFPGGIHSGTDWYLNDAGLVIGETTVGQTPFNMEGTPQSNRIRKAAQYASSIDEVTEILRRQNNGLYTNDWVIADAKTEEGAVLTLGTAASKLWRTGSKGKSADTPGNLKDFVWANNNNRSLEIRQEYMPNPENVPVDLAFNTWNRDIAFWKWFQEKRGQIDLSEAIRFWATSPVQRPHACDGKLTTSEMTQKLMFIAHQGKTTLREKWVGGRYIPDLPNAVPHLTYGYTTFSPIVVTEALKAAKRKADAVPSAPKLDVAKLKEQLSFDKKTLWIGTVIPASDSENWLSSGDAAYHALLRHLPEDPAKAFATQRDALSELNSRYLFLAQREGEQAPLQTRTAYDRYGAYQIPRIKGVFALHQLRLWLGNAGFAKAMGRVHDAYAGKPIRTDQFLASLGEAASMVRPWLERKGLPDVSVEAQSTKGDQGFTVTLTVRQKGEVYPFVTTVALETASSTRLERVEVKEAESRFTFTLPEAPTRLLFNAGRDIPVATAPAPVLPNLLDEWESLLFVPGTSHQVEANRSLLANFRNLVADTFTEVLPEIRPDAEVSAQDRQDRDLVIFGGIDQNALLARLAEEHKLPVTFGKGFFRFQGRTYAGAEDGIALALPNPWNPRRQIYLYSANTRVQLWQMTKALQRGLPNWALWKGSEVVARGFFENPALTVVFK
ncbi:MAG: C45 family autoproteolytic acyltransferase/hydrolase [Firmicutes bacterium]|nr:C45 family autoproteolytic acyltransferase/hydrolase [Bacillota bacterium]